MRLLSLSLLATAVVAQQRPAPSRLASVPPNGNSNNRIPGRFIVRFNETLLARSGRSALQAASAILGGAHWTRARGHTNRHMSSYLILDGLDEGSANRLRGSKDVEEVEQDGFIRIAAVNVQPLEDDTTVLAADTHLRGSRRLGSFSAFNQGEYSQICCS